MNRPSGRFTHMTMIWGQFIDHDLTLAAPQKIDCPTQKDKCTKEPNRGECFGIPVPESDPHFPNVGVQCLHLVRNAPACNSRWKPREQVRGGIVIIERAGQASLLFDFVLYPFFVGFGTAYNTKGFEMRLKHLTCSCRRIWLIRKIKQYAQSLFVHCYRKKQLFTLLLTFIELHKQLILTMVNV